MASLDRCERTIDAGELGGRLFFNVAGLGFDAAVARTSNRSRRRRGLLRYGMTAARLLPTYRSQTYEIDVDGSLLRTRALLIAVANGPQYGAGVRIAPHARPDDGQLEVVVVEDRPLRQVVWQIPRLFSGAVDRVPGVVTHPVRQARFSSDRRILFHVDGEVVEGDEALTVRVMPGALRVRAPR